jgi:hypothetical protein
MSKAPRDVSAIIQAMRRVFLGNVSETHFLPISDSNRVNTYQTKFVVRESTKIH